MLGDLGEKLAAGQDQKEWSGEKRDDSGRWPIPSHLADGAAKRHGEHQEGSERFQGRNHISHHHLDIAYK